MPRSEFGPTGTAVANKGGDVRMGAQHRAHGARQSSRTSRHPMPCHRAGAARSHPARHRRPAPAPRPCRNMPVQRRGAGLQLCGEVPHAQRAQPFAVDQLKGAGDDAIQRDGNAPDRLRPALAGCPPRRRARGCQILLIVNCLLVRVPATATLYPREVWHERPPALIISNHTFSGTDVWDLVRMRAQRSADQIAFVWHPYDGSPTGNGPIANWRGCSWTGRGPPAPGYRTWRQGPDPPGELPRICRCLVCVRRDRRRRRHDQHPLRSGRDALFQRGQPAGLRDHPATVCGNDRHLCPAAQMAGGRGPQCRRKRGQEGPANEARPR